MRIYTEESSLFIKIFLSLFILLIIVLAIVIISRIRSKIHFLPKNVEKSKGIVVVLHGITKTNKIMFKLSKNISNDGYEVFSFTYPSRKYNIDKLIDIVYSYLKSNSIEDKKISIVAHSMGGLITRGLIARYNLNISKVIQIGTPNHGSEVADFFQKMWFFKKIYGPAGQDLVTTSTIYKTILATNINYDLGIIAGNKSQNFIFSRIIPGEDDGLVSVESTKLNGMKDHVVLKVKHEYSLFDDNVSLLVVRFLNNSSFR